MSSPHYSFTGSSAGVINTISREIKEVDTSVPATLYNHRRYLYLVRRLAEEMEGQIDSWTDLDCLAESNSSLIATVNRELGLKPERYEDQSEDEGRRTPQQSGDIHDASPDMRPAPPHRRQRGTTPQQIGARFGEFPDMLPAPSFMQTARSLGFATPPQYTAISSSPPSRAPRPDYRATTEDEEQRADAFPTQDAQRIQMEAGAESRDAYLGSSQDTAVDYPSSQSEEEDERKFAEFHDA